MLSIHITQQLTHSLIQLRSPLAGPSAIPLVRPMAVAVQQPSVECIANFIMCIVEHHPPPCAVTIHKICTDQRWNGYQNIAQIQYQRSMCWQHTKHFDRTQ